MKKTITTLVCATVAAMSQPLMAEPVEFKVLSDWGSGYTAQLKLTNESDKAMTDWRLSFDFDGEIKNLYSGQLVSTNEGHFILQGKSWNRSLKPGQSVYLGWSGNKGGVSTQLSNVTFSGTDIDAPDGPYLVGYDLQADWGSGFVASMSLTNSGSQVMSQWQMTFDYPYDINHIYNAKIISHEGNKYTIEGIDEGASLDKNEVTVFVLRGNQGNLTKRPENIEVTYR